MSEQEADRQKEIEALLVERKKFEAWLAQLEAKRGSAASHVFDRVFADYTKRLEDVRERLTSEADTLRTLVSNLETRLGKEQEKVNKKTDERAEAELRALVGEFSEGEWASTKKKLDTAIADLRAKFDGTERELADLKGLLGSVTGAPAPARPSMMVAADALVTADLDRASSAAAVIDEPETAESTAEGKKPEPEAAAPVESKEPEAEPAKAEAATVEPAKAEPPKAEAAKAEPAKAEPAPRKSTPFDELAFLRSVAGTPSRPSGTAAVPAPPAPAAVVPAPPPAPVPTMPEPPLMSEPEAVEDDASLAPAPEEEAPAPRSSKATNPDGEPVPLGAPTPRTSQAIRSLKCGECGTLNFPTEWYCERCGGELAAF